MAMLKRYTVVIRWKDPTREPLRIEHVLQLAMSSTFLKLDIGHEHERFYWAHEIEHVDRTVEPAVLPS